MRPQSVSSLLGFIFVTAALLHGQQQLPLTVAPAAQPTADLNTEAGSADSNASPEVDKIAPDRPAPRAVVSESSQIKAAVDVLTNVLQQYRIKGNRSGEAGTLCALANSYNALGQQQKALEMFQEALAIIRVSGTKQDEARTLSHIGDVYRGWGFPDQAVHYYRQAISAYSSTTDTEGRAIAFNNLGVAYLMLRDKRKSQETLSHALAVYRTLSDPHSEGLTLNNLGMVYSTLSNDAQKALDMFQEAMTKLQLGDDKDAQATVLDNIGAVCVKLGNRDLAELSFDHALALFRTVPDAVGEARVLKHLSSLGQSGTVASSRLFPAVK